MFKASGRTAEGLPVVVLGLSEENVTRLVAGESIRITPSSMRRLSLPPMEIVIHYGRTEADIAEQLIALGFIRRDQEIKAT